MGEKKRRPRTERRAEERATRKQVHARQRLATLAPGGAADRPITVVSSSVIEVRAGSLPCPLCAGACRVEDHAARRVQGHSLRELTMRCTRCGIARSLWFRIQPELPS